MTTEAASDGSKSMAARVTLFKKAFPRPDLVNWYEQTCPARNADFVVGLTLHFARQLIPNGFQEIAVTSPEMTDNRCLYPENATFYDSTAFRFSAIHEHEIGLISGFFRNESEIPALISCFTIPAPHANRLLFIEESLWSKVTLPEHCPGHLLYNENFMEWDPERWHLIYVSNRRAVD